MKNTEDENDSNYHDDLIDVNKQSLTIKKYYFPTLSQKIIKLNKIKSISMLELNRANGKYTFFGFSWTFHYYHLDRKRPCKNHAIIIEEEDNRIKIGITPDNPEKCFSVLNKLLSYNKESELMSLK